MFIDWIDELVIVTEANWDLFYTFEQPVLPLLKLFKCKTVAFGRIHDIRKQLIKKQCKSLSFNMIIHVNVLHFQMKKYRLSEWIKNKIQLHTVYKRLTLDFMTQAESEQVEKEMSCK